MDVRKALAQGSALPFPGMDCVIENEIGRGSNAIVYRGWYLDTLHQRHHVLVKELFPYHEKGAIFRDENLAIVCREDGEALFKLHTQSFVWGNEVHMALREKRPSQIGGNLNTFPLHNTYYTILDFTGGRDLKTELQGRTATLRQTVQRMLGVLDSLDIFHQLGYLHLDISPDNILITDGGARERIELIDFNSVIAMNRLHDVRFSVKPGFASPEVRMQSLHAMGPWTDLYSVTAVFFAALMGRTLERMEQSGVKAIDPTASAMLQSVPETVKSMVKQILVRGLSPVARKRYESVEAMRADMLELLDRIDGVGVTHSALWEMSRQSIQREMRQNPALQYIAQEKELYPIEVGMPEGSSMEAFLLGRCHAMISGSGGMGKTTLMMRTVYEESRKYRRDRAAVLYLPLYGYQEGDAHFIHDSILRRMKFKPDIESYAMARHALDVLLQRPLRNKGGECPALCLMLDGYNEITGDPSALRKEIAQFAQMDGVRVMLSSRTPVEDLAFEKWHMQPLPKEAVSEVLIAHHLLVPESGQMQTLLSNPMMLSLFVKTSIDTQEQLAVQTREELIGAYLTALVEKQEEDKWQTEAAVRCVYPLLADHEARNRSGDFMKALEQLFASLSSRAFLKRFPGFVGHVAEIRGGAKDADQWYGLMIHDVLWRRLGLLRQEADGGYRIMHQEFRDVLSAQGKPIRELLQRHKTQRTAALASLVTALVLMLVLGVMALVGNQPKAYDKTDAYDMLASYDFLFMKGFYQCHYLLSELDRVTDAENPTKFNYPPSGNELASMPFLVANARGASMKLTTQDASLVMPWSGHSFHANTAEDVIVLYNHQEKYYPLYGRVFQKMLDDPEYYAYFGPEFANQLRQAVEADLMRLSWYYYDLIVPELETMRDRDPDMYHNLVYAYSLPDGMPLAVDTSIPLDESTYRNLWMLVETSPPALDFGEE